MSNPRLSVTIEGEPADLRQIVPLAVWICTDGDDPEADYEGLPEALATCLTMITAQVQTARAHPDTTNAGTIITNHEWTTTHRAALALLASEARRMAETLEAFLTPPQETSDQRDPLTSAE